ncbi:MAG: hypothetical protein ACAI44_40270 [Candidatus Sericytochromatia bacterium]
MKVLETFAKLEAALPLAQDLGQVVNSFRLRLSRVTGQYNGVPLEMPRVQTLLLSDETPAGPQARTLLLAAEFDPAATAELAKHFPAVADAGPEPRGLLFRLAPEVLELYGADFAATTELSDWLAIGRGAFLNLANYACIGYFDFG